MTPTGEVRRVSDEILGRIVSGAYPSGPTPPVGAGAGDRARLWPQHRPRGASVPHRRSAWCGAGGAPARWCSTSGARGRRRSCRAYVLARPVRPPGRRRSRGSSCCGALAARWRGGAACGPYGDAAALAEAARDPRPRAGARRAIRSRTRDNELELFRALVCVERHLAGRLARQRVLGARCASSTACSPASSAVSRRTTRSEMERCSTASRRATTAAAAGRSSSAWFDARRRRAPRRSSRRVLGTRPGDAPERRCPHEPRLPSCSIAHRSARCCRSSRGSRAASSSATRAHVVLRARHLTRKEQAIVAACADALFPPGGPIPLSGTEAGPGRVHGWLRRRACRRRRAR